MAKKGYILLARAISESDIWSKPPYYIKAWIYILNKAAFKPYGNFEIGECFVTLEELQKQCMYKAGRRMEEPSRKQMRDFIEFLKSNGGNDESNNGSNDESNKKGAMIVTKKVKNGMLIKVLNYERYQTSENYESDDESNNESRKKVIRKSDEGPMKVPTNKEALRSIKALEALEPHLSNEIIAYDSADEITKKNEDIFPDIEKELEEKAAEAAEIYETNLFELYETEFARPLSQMELQRLSQWAEDYDDKLIRYALREMLTYDKKSFYYVDKILSGWNEKKFTAEMYEDGKR